PAIPSTWVTGVTSTSAVMRAEVNPEGLATSYHFQYIADAAFEANLETGREGFFGARSVPTSNNGLGSGSVPQEVSFALIAPANPLAPATAYRYRVLASNSAGAAETPGP